MQCTLGQSSYWWMAEYTHRASVVLTKLEVQNNHLSRIQSYRIRRRLNTGAPGPGSLTSYHNLHTAGPADTTQIVTSALWPLDFIYCSTQGQWEYTYFLFLFVNWNWNTWIHLEPVKTQYTGLAGLKYFFWVNIRSLHGDYFKNLSRRIWWHSSMFTVTLLPASRYLERLSSSEGTGRDGRLLWYRKVRSGRDSDKLLSISSPWNKFRLEPQNIHLS